MPFCTAPGPYYYEQSVGPVNVSVLGAMELFPNFSLQAAVGPYIFNDGVVIGLSAYGVYAIPIQPKTAIPIAAYADVVFGDGIPVSFGAAVGFQHLLDLKR